MILFTVSVFSEDSGPGSRPDVSTFFFSSQEKRLSFVQDWIAEQESCKRERCDDELKFFGGGDWVYWIEQAEIEIDCTYSHGRILKRY